VKGRAPTSPVRIEALLANTADSMDQAVQLLDAFSDSSASVVARFATGALVADGFLAGRTLGSLPSSTPIDLSSASRSGPLFSVQGDLVARSDADLNTVSQRLSAAIVASSMAAGVR
jgi:hypothetical protein